MAVFGDFSPGLVRKPLPHVVIVKKQQEFFGQGWYVASRHDKTVPAVFKVHHFCGLISFFCYERKTAVEGVNDAKTNSPRKTVNVRRGEQVEHLRSVYGPQVVHVVTLEAVENPV